MKILEEKYPLGSFPNQKSPGRYIDAFLYENLKLLATKIKDDMTFLMICFSSTLEVGTGKSVFMTQLGEAWSEIIRKEQGIDLNFSTQNIVWRPRDLIERAFQVPKYSFILLDEWEDAHYWSELGMTLRQFFRKCRQLNLFIGMVIPNYFQLPMNYALGRSIFAIDVKFTGDFERGNYDFYDFEKKRELYIKGKKTHNYHVVKPSFSGVFNDGYGVDREEYLKAKREDLEKWDKDEGKDMKPEQLIFYTKIRTLRVLYERDFITSRMIAELYGCTQRTAQEWMQKAKEIEPEMANKFPLAHYNQGKIGKVRVYIPREVILSNTKSVNLNPTTDEEEQLEEEVEEE